MSRSDGKTRLQAQGPDRIQHPLRLVSVVPDSAGADSRCAPKGEICTPNTCISTSLSVREIELSYLQSFPYKINLPSPHFGGHT